MAEQQSVGASVAASMAQPVQDLESARVDSMDYFDVMIIGHTGQGKSTTSDKLLIANREMAPCTTDVDVIRNSEKMQLQCGDISLWMTTPSDFLKEETRLKKLVFTRASKEPHVLLQQIRESMSESEDDSGSTKHCEVFSNEMSKVRVLDVPGFFDEESITGGSETSIENAQSNTLAFNLGIMRKILRIQTVMKMNFKRILYFLPVRGPLERASGVLQLELRVLTHYFGQSVFNKLVLVATNPPDMSELGIPEDRAFSVKRRTTTKRNFDKSLTKIFKGNEVPNIPLIYLSLSDTCEVVLEKVIKAEVNPDDLHLQLDPNVCECCGKKVGTVQGEKVVCYIDGEYMIPYYESTCHPKLVPDYKFKHKLAEFFVRIFTLGLKNSLAQYFLLDEICHKCRAPAGRHGCMQVGTEYRYTKKERIKVDHKCNQWEEHQNESFQAEPPPDPAEPTEAVQTEQ